ncbi:MAG: hypothetical protein HKL91_07430 [Candidatus Eremiobacteraeota bacterium]|nr:hypothetical protein [Candidatus Eremiobacteraeota bacterium]
MLAKVPSMHARIDASWKGAARIVLRYDFTNRRRVPHPTVVYVAQDSQGLDFAFRVRQRSRVAASTVSNGSAIFGDDSVQVSLDPQGVQGFAYQFSANPRGAHYQTSSENSAYTPHWLSRGRITKTGYTVTMHVPFHIIRSGGSHSWKAQFARFDLKANSVQVWSYDAVATSPTMAIYSGTLSGVAIGSGKKAKSTRPKARFQPYLLGVGRSGAAGGSTSQMGLDMAVPITPTASFVGSFHPDYSNVETDQQTISPTAFPRQYQEVRPFFTQVGNAFNAVFSCALSCPSLLYTPAIPSFRQGYGVEGTQGPFSFSGFDAVGARRTDLAEALDFGEQNSRNSYGINAQGVSVSTPTFVDTTASLNGGFLDNRSHIGIYGNYARESGTFITDASQARYGELGAVYQTANTFAGVARQFTGAQFSPVDAYIQQNNTAGYEAGGRHVFHMAPRSKLLDIQVSAFDTRFWNNASQIAQEEANWQVGLDLRNLWTVNVFQNSTFVRASDGEFLPFNVGNGAFLGYDLNSNYPVGILFGDGPYYHGHAATEQFFDTLPVRRNLSLSLNVNENSYTSNRSTEPSFKQWLNSASLNWQFSRDASFSLGARRINGTSLPTSYYTPTFTPIFADNLSAAFHYLHGHNEFYLVYGDPNALTTTPAVFFKWIFYAGAEKGT